MPARKLFGTDGIRGIANQYPLDGSTSFRIGQAVAYVFRNGESRHRILIGKDTRLSGYLIEYALVSGVVSVGLDAYLVGPLPTPGIAFLTSSMRADAGIVVSASHNSYEYNGIKIFDGEGFKISDEMELLLEEYIFHPESMEGGIAPPDRVGKAFRIDDAVGRYVVFLKGTFPRSLSLRGMKIILDCANGAGYRVAPEVLTELGADLFPIGVNPDGKNINLDVGVLSPQSAQKRVIAVGADLGIVLDGDGDRVLLIDEHGEILDGDTLLAIVGKYLLKKGDLKKNTVVTTVASNLALDRFFAELGGKVIRTPVGDRYVSLTLREIGGNFGGEESGHLVFMDFNPTGDGVLSALQVLRILLETGKPLSELKKIFVPFPRVKRDVEIQEKVPLEEIEGLEKLKRDFEKIFNGNGRVLVRYSGTEPKIRILLEGENLQRLEWFADRFQETILSFTRSRR